MFQMFLVEESEYYTLYNEEEKNEFLFKILQHLVLGGPVNQVLNEQYIICSSNCVDLLWYSFTV